MSRPDNLPTVNMAPVNKGPVDAYTQYRYANGVKASVDNKGGGAINLGTYAGTGNMISFGADEGVILSPDECNQNFGGNVAVQLIDGSVDVYIPSEAGGFKVRSFMPGKPGEFTPIPGKPDSFEPSPNTSTLFKSGWDDQGKWHAKKYLH
jgi:hypothetical protein